MELGLKGKVAAITGGSEGIGLATAIKLGLEGASVGICARRHEPLKKAADDIQAVAGIEPLVLAADMTHPGEPEHFIEDVVTRFGRLDILINNVGREAVGPFEETNDAAWQADLDLKLFSAIRAIRAAIPHMRAINGGRVINITHVGAKQPRARSVPTSVTRAAGIALTKALSKELAKDRILVNTVCVGLIWSNQWERKRYAFSAPLSREEYEHQLVTERDIPLGRMGRTDEVASLIAFLASEQASYITGASINIDGGLCAVV